MYMHFYYFYYFTLIYSFNCYILYIQLMIINGFYQTSSYYLKLYNNIFQIQKLKPNLQTQSSFSSRYLPMTTPYTQAQAYKHLLQVSQNILHSSDIDQQILTKYQQLKKSILKKITKHDHFYLTLVNSYRSLVDNAIKIVQGFEEELENQMERTNFNQLVIGLNDAFLGKIKELQAEIQLQSSNTKTRLLHKQELNTLRDQYDQLDSKFENLGLLIEVHKKMHQIILEATKTEQKKSNSELNYKEKIKLLEKQLQDVGDVKEFIQQHKITQEKYGEFKVAAKALKKVLFSQYR